MRPDSSSRSRVRGAASTWVFGGFALVALFFLLTEHRAHLYGWLPFILLAACPLMHLFHGHGGHGSHAHHRAADEPADNGETQPTGIQPKSDAELPPAVPHRH